MLAQIFDVIADAGRPCNIASVCLYGGTKKGPQITDLKAGVVSFSDGEIFSVDCKFTR